MARLPASPLGATAGTFVPLRLRPPPRPAAALPSPGGLTGPLRPDRGARVRGEARGSPWLLVNPPGRTTSRSMVVVVTGLGTVCAVGFNVAAGVIMLLRLRCASRPVVTLAAKPVAVASGAGAMVLDAAFAEMPETERVPSNRSAESTMDPTTQRTILNQPLVNNHEGGPPPTRRVFDGGLARLCGGVCAGTPETTP